MAVKIVEDSAVLTLDFWDKETIYNGQVFPVGTLACDALNIPTEVVSHMEKLCEKLNGFMRTFDSGKGDPALLPEAKFSAMKLLELMAKYKPFSYINMTAFCCRKLLGFLSGRTQNPPVLWLTESACSHPE